LKTLGRDAVMLQADVSNPTEARRLVHQVIDHFGKLDIVVNNAAINKQRPIEDLSLEEFREVQDTNLIGPWLLCRP